MSTIERKNGKIFFQFDNQMITVINNKFVTESGEPVDGRKVRGFLRNKNNMALRSEVAHIKSIMNRFFGGSYGY